MPNRPNVIIATSEGLPAARILQSRRDSEICRAGDVSHVVSLLAAGLFGTAFLSLGSVSTANILSITSAARTGRTGIGFIFGWAGIEIAERHAEKLTTYEWQHSRDAFIWSVQPLGTVRDVSGDGITVASGPRSDLERRLMERRRFTGLCAHGGIGIDMRVGSAVVCSMLRRAPRELDSASWTCAHQNGPCGRSQPVQGGGIALPNRVAPQDIASDVIVLDSCRALTTGSGPRDAGASVSAGIVTGPYGNVLFTSLGATEGIVSAHLLILNDLRSGKPAHVACSLLNRVHSHVGNTSPWLLIGDPLAVVPDGDRQIGDVTNQLWSVSEFEQSVSTPTERALLLNGVTKNLERRQIWVEAVPGTCRAIVVAEGLSDSDKPVACDPQDIPLFRTIQEEVFATPGISYSLHAVRKSSFFLDVHGKEDGERLSAALEDRLEDIASTQSAGRAEVLVSGAAEMIAAAGERREAQWVQLQREVANYGALHARTSNTMRTDRHSDRKVLGTNGETSGIVCPYCGDPVSRTRLQIPALGHTRSEFSCWQCDLIYDGSDRGEPLALDGPLDIRLGESAHYELTWLGVDGVRKPLPGVRGAAKLAVKAVPWEVVSHSETVDFLGGVPSLTIRIDSAPIGIHYLIGSVSLAGEIHSLARPIRIVQP